MDLERWKQVDSLLQSVLERDPRGARGISAAGVCRRQEPGTRSPIAEAE